MARAAVALDFSVDDIVARYEREGPFPLRDDVDVRLALEDADTCWERQDGLLVEKPSMSYQHGDVSFELGFAFREQLDPERFRVRVQHGRLPAIRGDYVIPDVIVIPTGILGLEIHRLDVLETYTEPLPFVAEVWPPSTVRPPRRRCRHRVVARGGDRSECAVRRRLRQPRPRA